MDAAGEGTDAAAMRRKDWVMRSKHDFGGFQGEKSPVPETVRPGDIEVFPQRLNVSGSPALNVSTSPGLCVSASLARWNRKSPIEVDEELEDLIDSCLPDGPTQIEPALFRLLRIIKTQLENETSIEDASSEVHPGFLCNIIERWSNSAAAILGTDDRTGEPYVTWTNARGWAAEAWPSIRHRMGDGPLDHALQYGRQLEIPDRYDDARLETVRRLCIGLDATQRDDKGQFRVTHRAAEDATGIGRNIVRTLLSTLVFDGVIERVERGRQGYASRYRLLEDLDAEPALEEREIPNDAEAWPDTDADQPGEEWPPER